MVNRSRERGKKEKSSVGVMVRDGVSGIAL